jgi:hypothetical protein
MFVHRGCGGALVVDVTSAYRLISPSISIGNGSLVIGVTELRESSGKIPPSFLCTKCSTVVEDVAKDVEVRCMICGDFHPVDEMKGSRQLSNICDSCVSYIKGEKTPVPARLSKTLTYLNLKGSEVKFYKLSDVLKKSISVS